MRLRPLVLIAIALVQAMAGVCESAETIQTFKVPRNVHLYWCGHRLTGKVKATIANDTLYLNGKGPWLAAADTMDKFRGMMIGCGYGYSTLSMQDTSVVFSNELIKIVAGIHAGKSLDELRSTASPTLIDTSRAFSLEDSALTLTLAVGKSRSYPIKGSSLARISDPNRRHLARLNEIVWEATKWEGMKGRKSRLLIVANRLRTAIYGGGDTEQISKSIAEGRDSISLPRGMMAEIRGVQVRTKQRS